LFTNDCNNISLQQLRDASRHTSRLQNLMVVLVQAVGVLVSKEYVYSCPHARDGAVESYRGLTTDHTVTQADSAS
jgi:hypothetical protein